MIPLMVATKNSDQNTVAALLSVRVTMRIVIALTA